MSRKRAGDIQRYRRREAIEGHLFALPAIILLAIFVLYPVVRNLIWSLQDWNGIKLYPAKYVGIKNYLALFKTKAFKTAFVNTVKYSTGATTCTVVFGLLLALPIDRRIKGWKAFKFIFYIPPMLPTLAVGALFLKILDNNTGALNHMLETVGLESWTKAWLTNPKLAFRSLLVASTWQFSGYTMLLFLSSLTGISNEIHEAATLDGVSEVQRAFMISLPMIKRQIQVVIMTQLIFSFRSYEMIKILTNGGPGTSTTVLSILLYNTGLTSMDYGMAATYGMVMLTVVSIVSIIYLKVSGLSKQVRE